MSLSFAAKQNIATAAMKSYFSDKSNVDEAALLIASTVIEQEIGFADTDIAPDLFTDLVSHLLDTIYVKLDELSQ
jgi:hypothetical protein